STELPGFDRRRETRVTELPAFDVMNMGVPKGLGEAATPAPTAAPPPAAGLNPMPPSTQVGSGPGGPPIPSVTTPRNATERQAMLDRMRHVAGITESGSGDESDTGWAPPHKWITVKNADGSTHQDRAYGKFGVMGANVPAWTQKYYGQALTPQQFE